MPADDSGTDGGMSNDAGFIAPGDGGMPVPIDPSNVIPSTPLSMLKPQLQTATNPIAPTGVFGGHATPLPTNAFWENFVLQNGDQVTVPFPYQIHATSAGLGVSKPESLTVANTSSTESAGPQIVFGAAAAFTTHTVASWDPLSTTVTWQGAGGTMSAPVVHGMPYASALYDGLTPKITAPGGIRTVNGSATGSATGARFDIVLASGQQWLLYASQPVSVTWGANGVTFGGPLHGSVRAARTDASIGAAVLDQFAGAIPVGGQLQLSVQGDTGVVQFSWQTQGSGDLLMMALPHHADHLVSPQTASATFASVRGKLQGIVGATWQLQYALSPAIRAAPRPVDPAHQADVLAALNSDKGYQPGGNAVYFFGKSIGKAAELLLIAEALGETATADSLRQTIEGALSPWLDGTSPDSLVYDQTYGGIITSSGAMNSGNDFGNGIYNDHHFQYGYLLYAAGAVAKGDPAWAMQHREGVLNLIRDIANPSASDPYFTQFRMTDFYEGHSWASGLWPFGDGRNQESSSEAFNAWAGITLFGDATGDKTLLSLGRLMRAVEAASVQRYYHIRKASDIYPAPFNANASVGILWSDKAAFATFFGNTPSSTYGIQLLPMTMASEELIDQPWIQDMWPTLQAAAGNDGWGGLIYMTHAIIDKQAAWQELTGAGVEAGNSRTNMLYWAATRP
jgi:endo-1,3(4)-beta-glucanase